jgi:protein-L-isoaspartate(D-aspartate) O-methyltransferase
VGYNDCEFAMSDDAKAREAMVDETIAARGIEDPRVLAAMREVERHRFVDESQRSSAYADMPLAIGCGATISQPYIVALMSELADVHPGDRVLEIGTGSGYQAAVLAELGAEVHSIERVAELYERARDNLAAAGYERVRLRHGDGHLGWPEAAPFRAILLTAAPTEIPKPLLDQLAVGGRLIAPIGERRAQSLLVVERTESGLRERVVLDVAFVPMLPGTSER